MKAAGAHESAGSSLSASGGSHRWKSSGGTLLARWSYDYDRIGNKKYQEGLQSATQSELYDDVYRIADSRGSQLP